MSSKKLITVEEMFEGEVSFKSKTLPVVYEVLQGRDISSDLWKYFSLTENDDKLKDLFNRMPHSENRYAKIKLEIFEIRLRNKKVTSTDIRGITERLNGATELLLEILKRYKEYSLVKSQELRVAREQKQ